MQRNLLLPSIGVVLFAVLAATGRAAESKRPNIVFLLTDDQRWNTLGCMGNTIIRTPNIDRLAEQGIVFDNAFVTTSICMTNRTCIFTGQYAARHGNWSFAHSFTPNQLAQTYPALLKKSGYYIGFIGKWGVGRPPQGLFDYNKGWPGQNRYEHKVDGKPIHLTRLMGNQALEFLDGVPDGRPFCLSLSFKAPHVQDGDPRQFIPDPALMSLYAEVTIPPPKLGDPAFFRAQPEFLRKSLNRVRWQRRFTPEKYQEMVKNHHRLISGVDRQVGRIVRKLRRRGLDENTIILYTGDNGFYLGERGFAGKWLAHELSIRVPLVIYDPLLPAGRRGKRLGQVALSIDLAPTMLAMAEVKIPARMQGKSLLPLLEGKEVPWRTEFFYEHYFAPKQIPASEAVRDRRYKYIRYVKVEPPYEELYDLKADPDEADNLAGKPQHAGTLELMRKKWAAWRQRVK